VHTRNAANLSLAIIGLFPSLGVYASPANAAADPASPIIIFNTILRLLTTNYGN
jgi:hypothetical protein